METPLNWLPQGAHVLSHAAYVYFQSDVGLFLCDTQSSMVPPAHL